MPGALGCLKPVVCSWCTPLNKYNIEATHCLSMGDVFTCDSCVQTISVFLWCLFYRWCRCCSTVDLSLLKARAFGNLRERFPVRLWWMPGLSGEESMAQLCRKVLRCCLPRLFGKDSVALSTILIISQVHNYERSVFYLNLSTAWDAGVGGVWVSGMSSTLKVEGGGQVFQFHQMEFDY